MGVAKLVVHAGTPEPDFKRALDILKLVVSSTCQDAALSVMKQELRTLRDRLMELQRFRPGDRLRTGGPRARRAAVRGTSTGQRTVALVDRALAHLQRHCQDPALSLRSVAASLGCNPRYLTTRFTQIVGERMHTYLIALRASNACLLLLSTDLPVKEVAYVSGFSGAGRMAGAFRTHVGVSPSEYRRIFTAP